MKKTLLLTLNGLAIAGLMTAAPTLWAQTSPASPVHQPDKFMEAAHQSFVKGDMNKASEQIQKAAGYVKRESEKVSQGTKAEAMKAGDELDKLGHGVKTGTVKSEAELKKTFAKVDHQMATCWHKTADESRKEGKDASADLKKAGASLSGAAKWSGVKLKEGTQSSIEAVQKAGKSVSQGTKAGVEEVDKWFKGIGEGITDLGHKL